MKSILCDINVFIDIFLERKKFYYSSAKIFSLVEKNQLSGYISSLSYGTIYYLLSKEIDKLVAIKTLEKIKHVFKTANVDDKFIDFGIGSLGNPDFRIGYDGTSKNLWFKGSGGLGTYSNAFEFNPSDLPIDFIYNSQNTPSLFFINGTDDTINIKGNVTMEGNLTINKNLLVGDGIVVNNRNVILRQVKSFGYPSPQTGSANRVLEPGHRAIIGSSSKRGHLIVRNMSLDSIAIIVDINANTSFQNLPFKIYDGSTLVYTETILNIDKGNGHTQYNTFPQGVYNFTEGNVLRVVMAVPSGMTTDDVIVDVGYTDDY